MEDEKTPHVSKEHEKFMKEFIQLYKENKLLWDKSHPKYKSRVARNAAFDVIINKCREYYPDASIDFVKHKIEGMRTAFRREHKKVLESKNADNNIYVPSLWYYNHFLFIVGEEYNDNLDTNEDSYKNIYFWSKEHTATLIELLKKHPILYSLDASSNTAKVQRLKAYNQLTKDFIAETGKHFNVEEVKRKIASLKTQFRRECRNKSNGRPHNTLWCYELLMFVKEFWIKKDEENDENDVSDDSADKDNIVLIKDDDPHVDIDKKDEKMFIDESYDDIFDTIGKNVAIKLRDMSDDQRKYAEDLVNQVMYNGLMENLNADSTITLK